MKRNLLFSQTTALGKTLGKRLAMVLTMLLIVGIGQAWGEESLQVTLDFTSGNWEFPSGSSNKTYQENTYTHNGYSIKLAGGGNSNGHYFNTQDKYLLMGKSGATLTLPAFDFNTTKIVVTGKSGASGSVKQNIYVGSNAVSTETTGATGTNTYTINAANQAAGNVYILKVTSAHNTQITKIEVYGESNSSEPPTPTTQYTIKWHTAKGVTTDVTLNEGATITKPATDPTMSGYVFMGWTEACEVASNGSDFTAITNFGTATENKDYYAVFAKANISNGGGDYIRVTQNLADWSGDYLIAYSNTIFANGKIGGTDGIGKQYNTVDLSQYVDNNIIPVEYGDPIHITLEKSSTEKYLLKTQDGKYNYYTSNNNGISSTTNQNTANQYAITITYTSKDDIKLCLSGNAQGAVFRYNAQGYFRFYKNGGQNPVYLYKKSAGTTTYSNYITTCTTKPTYSVTLNPNSGTINEGDVTSYIEGKGVTLPTNVTRTGYTFDGWYNNSNLTGNPVTVIGTDETGDKEFWAKWTINQYTVTLNPNYPAGKTGTFIDNNGNTVNQVQLTYDYNTLSMSLTGLYQSIELEGYQFNGWYSATSGGSKWTETGTITQNVTVYAQWSKLYTITLYENGTTTTPTTQTSTSYTLPTELSVGTCENDEKELVGWSTVAIPTPGDKPTDKFYDLGKTVTLTADQTTFYAVFATASESTTIFKRMQTLDELNNASKIAIINAYSSSTYILNTSLTSAATAPKESSGKITVTEGQYWTLEKSNSYWKFKNSDNKYLTTNTIPTSSSKSGSVQLATSGNNEWVIANNTYTNNGTPVFTIYNASSKNAGLEYNNGWILFYSTDFNTSWFTLKLYIPDVSYSDYTTTCVKLPDPVLSFATEPANPIVFTDAVCGGNSSKQSVTVVGENLRDVVNVSVTGPYKIARTSSTALKDFTTSLTLDKTNAGETVYIISCPPAQSTDATTGTLTFTTDKGNTLTVNLSTPTVKCNTYKLTFNDRGSKTVQNYYAGVEVPQPEDPTGVCTDPIHYVFDGWAEAKVDEGSTTYTKVNFPYTMPKDDQTLYAVYRYVEDGSADSGDYVKVTENLDDYSGDYLIVYETGSVAFDGGLDELDEVENTISVTINSNTIESNATTDAAKFTIAKVDGGYSIKSASGYYIGWSTADKNGLNANSKYSANYYLNTISNSIISGVKGTLKYNKTADQKRFRYFKSGQEAIALYRKAASYLYTTSPVCGPHVEITSDKDIYVTSGLGAAHSTVVAQKKIEFSATRLKPSDKGAEPSIKVPAADITIDGTPTKKVSIAITQNLTLQADGETYAGTGEITISYTPTANNVTEDIHVQLRAEHNTGSDVSLDAFTVHARSLPSAFVIVAKQGDKWYALNGDMNTNAANPANGQVTLDNDANPKKATYAPCNTIYTFDGLPNTGDRTYVRFQGTDGAWLWASSGTNVGIQNNVLKTTPEGSNKAYNWKLYTEDNITYRFGNANSNRQLTLNGEKYGMYASGVQDIRILPYEAKCLYNYAPTNLKVSVLKGSYVTLTWDAVAGATKYQYSTDATYWTDCGTEPTVTINSLKGDFEYTYYIRAYHEDAGVSQECIDYAEITFTTADCDDVPTNITYTADLNSITVSWTAAAPTATIKLFMNEDGTGGGGTYPGATSPKTISGGLNPNTTYYIQILADGTCASPIIPVKTEDVEMDVVEWDPQGIIVDINTDETVGVTLENEVSYGSGLGIEATELFFSKYYEASYNVKLVAIYNGTKNIIDLTDYIIKYGKTSWESSYITLKDFGATKGQIQPGEEIILYSYTENNADDKKILDCVHDAFPDGNWVRVTNSNNTGKGILAFGGDKTLALFKGKNIIDIIGAVDGSTPNNSKANERPAWGNANGWICATGLSLADDSEIGISTNRCLLVRNNTVTSGANAVASNTTDFVTLCSEWKGAHVLDSDVDNGIQESCENFAYVGTFDYSDYYTKYVQMGEGTTFDENARNADGTVTIPITDLYKHACSHIRVKLTNEKGEVLTDREYKVPIMITSDQTTAGQTFLDLQQNLATKEVDTEGNVIGTHPLSLEDVREICKTCDVVVRDNATLTKVTDGTENDHPQVHDVIVYEGASIVIPDGINHNYTINSLSLRRKGDDVASAQVQGTGKLVLPADVPVTLNMLIDATNWHWFTLPYDCDIADVTWSDGTPAKYGTDWFLMYYDGASRAASTNPRDNHWKKYNGSTTIEAGKGYIIGITGNLAHPKYTFELRFPMAQEVLTKEQENKTVAVNAWGVQSDNNTPNNLGWNLVGNPYLNYYQPATSGFTGLPLIKYTEDHETGEWSAQSGDIPYLVTPVNGGWSEYQQELASNVDMLPFTAYFVQVGNPGTHTDGEELQANFETSKRGRASLIRRAPSEVDEQEEPAIVAVELTNSKGESDKTTLLIADRFTDEYEMNADFFKWFGDYYRYYTKPVLYTLGADNESRAFNALNEELAAQPVALGMYAAQAGNYTFSLNQRSNLTGVAEVWLHDANSNTHTNLMQDDYSFSTTKTNGAGRFSLSVKMASKVTTAVDNITANGIWATTQDNQIVINGLTKDLQLWIYDATGKLLHADHTTNYQHSYSVPTSGVYFVRVNGKTEAQTIKIVVE